MHVQIFNLYFHPEPTGTGLTIGELARDLVRLGHRVTVVTSVPHYGLDQAADGYRGKLVTEETWEGVRVIRTAVHVARRKTVVSRLTNYLSYAALAVPAGLRGPRPDVVLGVLPPVTTGPTVWLSSRLRRAPLVFSVQDVYPDSLFRIPLAARLNRMLERFLLSRAAWLIALSPGQRDMLIARGADPARITVVPMWTDVDTVRPGPKDNPFRTEHARGARLLALYAGNLGAYSGVGVLLEAASRLRDDARIRIVIAGRGHGQAALLRRAAALDLPNVTFLPTQPRERLSEMLAACDVGLVTLDPRLATGNVPSKTFTIMAAGRPVLAAVGERNEIARVVGEAGCGRVVAPDGVEEVAAALREWADDGSSLDAMGSRGRPWVERFHDRRSGVAAHAAILEKVKGRVP